VIIVNSSLKLCNCCSKNFSQRRVCWLSQKLHTVLKQCGSHNITDKLITTQQVYFCLASKVTKNTTMDPLYLDILVTWKILCSTTLHSLCFMHKYTYKKPNFRRNWVLHYSDFMEVDKKCSWLPHFKQRWWCYSTIFPQVRVNNEGLKNQSTSFSIFLKYRVAIQSLSRP